jgi:bacterioferritin-associated ferredoxin
MIVCSCNALSDKQILSAIRRRRPAKTHHVYACLGCRPRCGQCLATISRIWDEASRPRRAADAQRAIAS